MESVLSYSPLSCCGSHSALLIFVRVARSCPFLLSSFLRTCITTRCARVGFGNHWMVFTNHWRVGAAGPWRRKPE